jgi:hypothetical protein
VWRGPQQRQAHRVGLASQASVPVHQVLASARALP